MRVYIRRISPPSLSIVLGTIYGVIGLVFALLSVFGALVSFGIGSPIRNDISFTVMMLLCQPVISALCGVISGFILAWAYNFTASITRGVLIEFSEARRHDD